MTYLLLAAPAFASLGPPLSRSFSPEMAPIVVPQLLLFYAAVVFMLLRKRARAKAKREAEHAS